MSQDARRHSHPASSVTKTVQSAAQGNDVRDIVARHAPGHAIGNPHATRQPRFMDMPSESYHEMLNRVTDVQTTFGALPSRLKGKFANSPYQLLRWLEKPENRPEALELGLVVPTPEEAQQLADKAARSRRAEQVGMFREAMTPAPTPTSTPAPKADPESQPDYKGGTK